MAAPHAVVTGASSGIGHAITTTLLAAGWNVTGLSHRDPGFETAAGSFEWLAADLSEPDSLPGLVEGVGTVDALGHAAGFMTTAPLGALDPAALRGMFAVHVEAASALVDTLSERIADGGRVVLIGSRTMTGVAGKSHYAATKSAMTGLSRSWAIELAPRGITCNIVAPGPTDTPMLSDPGRAGGAAESPGTGQARRPRGCRRAGGLPAGPAWLLHHRADVDDLRGARRCNPQPHRAASVGSSGLMQPSLPVGKQLQSGEVSMG